MRLDDGEDLKWCGSAGGSVWFCESLTSASAASSPWQQLMKKSHSVTNHRTLHGRIAGQSMPL